MKSFINLFLILLISGISQVTFAQSATWKIDKSHSSVRFSVAHMVVSETTGKFNKFDGSFTASKPDLTDAKINFTVDAASIDTDNDSRDNHLRGDDFFNAEKYPTLSFKSVSFKKKGSNKYQLEGDLTIRDVTKRVKFDVVYGGMITSNGKTKAGFKVNGSINRFDYNLKWNKAIEAGGMVVDEEVAINLNLEFDKQSTGTVR